MIEYRNRKSMTKEEWEEEWQLATAIDKHDEGKVTTYYVQFHANVVSSTPDTYLCVHKDGSVCIDGSREQANTLFKVNHVYPTDRDYYQIICHGGDCKGYILYEDGNTLKVRPFCKATDSLKGDDKEASPTLFKFITDNENNFFINTLDESLQFCQAECEDSTDEPSSPNIFLAKQQAEDGISFEFTIVKITLD